MFPILRKNCVSLFSLQLCLQRNLSLSSVNHVKKIIETREGNNLILEAVIEPSSREPLLVKSESETKACPLCRLNLDVKHTDVLILSQFVRQDGTMLPKRITRLCSMQQRRVNYMVAMAHKAGLMGKFKPPNCKLDPRQRPEWKQWNTYFDETTIPGPKRALWLKYQKKIQDFKDSLKENKQSTE